MNRVVVSGLGAITPLGNNVTDSWEGLIQGKSGIGPITKFDVSNYTSRIAGEVRGFSPEDYIEKKDIKHMDSFAQLAVAASAMAIDDASLDMDKINKEECGVLIGSGIGGLNTIEIQHSLLLDKGPRRVSPFLIPMLIGNIASGYVAIRWRVKGPNSSINTACAAGSHALGDAYKIIQRGSAKLMISGGTEACITPLGLAGFCNMKALSTRNDEPQRASRPFDAKRNGFVMSEGAGIMILEELEHARNRQAKIYAEIIGYGMSADAHHITAPTPDGSGAALAITAAIDDAGIQPNQIDYINAHGTSTAANDRCETLAIKRALGEDHAYKVKISSTKSMTGHLLGAAGGVELMATILAIQKGIIHPTINYENPDPECDLDYTPNKAVKADITTAMSNSFGFGGHNACLIVKKYIP